MGIVRKRTPLPPAWSLPPPTGLRALADRSARTLSRLFCRSLTENRLQRNLRRIAPEPFQPVPLARLRQEQVNHHIESIDDQPAAVMCTLNPDQVHLRCIQGLFQFNRSAQVWIRVAVARTR